LIALASDNEEQLQMMVDRVFEATGGRPITYTLLSDPDASVINRYGLFNQNDPQGRAIPHPTTYVIDMDGIVRWKMTEIDYRLRPENADIAAALAAIGG
jgi:peroxiredoxin